MNTEQIGYGSARDLPSVQQMEEELAQFKRLGPLLTRDQRLELKGLESELRGITQTVDAFYALLGPRSWVYHDDLLLPEMRDVVDTDDPAEAEGRLIGYYRDTERIRASIRRFNTHDAGRPRLTLVEKALEDYTARRYYSTVLVLIAVMDGFVNEVASRGLHAQTPGEMTAWDSVAGHHLGLSHAHQSFRKGFYKTSEKETVELYRNGIMHGILVNYNNEVIATKAWNRLFALGDWADSRVRAEQPVEPEPSLDEVAARWFAMQEERAEISEWQSHEYDLRDDEPDPHALTLACVEFFERWSRRQYGPLAELFFEAGSEQDTYGHRAQAARELYSDYDLESWTGHRRRHIAAAVAFVDATIVVNGMERGVELRWLHVGDDNRPAVEWREGTWVLVPYGPLTFL